MRIKIFNDDNNNNISVQTLHVNTTVKLLPSDIALTQDTFSTLCSYKCTNICKNIPLQSCVTCTNFFNPLNKPQNKFFIRTKRMFCVSFSGS